MKGINFLMICILILGTIISFTSCEIEENLCEAVTCQNDGVCNNGLCDCPDGFSGTFCEIVEDPCVNITCQNDGVCIDGTCDCPDGYSGTFCEIEDDPCDAITCENGGVCNDGTCDCPDGYSGTFCEIEDRAQFIGSYSVSESCTTDDYEYNMSISNSTSAANEIILDGLYELTVGLNATVSGNDLTIVPGQSNTDQSNTGEFESIEGSGSISGNTVTITYTLMNHGATDNCTATLTKI